MLNRKVGNVTGQHSGNLANPFFGIKRINFYCSGTFPGLLFYRDMVVCGSGNLGKMGYANNLVTARKSMKKSKK